MVEDSYVIYHNKNFHFFSISKYGWNRELLERVRSLLSVNEGSLFLVEEVTITSEVGLVSSSLVGSTSGVLRSGIIRGGGHGGGMSVGVGLHGKPAVGANGCGGGGGLGGRRPKGAAEAAAAAANIPG